MAEGEGQRHASSAGRQWAARQHDRSDGVVSWGLGRSVVDTVL